MSKDSLELKNLKIVISFAIVLGTAMIGYLLFLWLRDDVPIENSLEQYEQAEVIGKRIAIKREGDSPDTYYYIVAFKLPDGSQKELQLGINEPGEENYNAIHEGYAGILTYKERKNIEKRYKYEAIRFMGRQFISFQTDAEYGKIRIELSEQPGISTLILGIGVTILLMAFLIVLMVVIYWL